MATSLATARRSSIISGTSVRFADGAELTAADVAFTYRAIVDPRNPVESVDAYRRVVSLQTPDRYTVVVRLRNPWNAAVAELFAQADFAFGILPAHAFASTDVRHGAWDQQPFGTGPFRVTQWQRANRIVLEPQSLLSRLRPRLRRIVLSLIPTTQSSLLALRTGEVDLTGIGPAQVPQARQIPHAHVVVTPVNGVYFLMAQTTAPPTNDVHVRRAIADAIDRREIVGAAFGVLRAADSFLPPVFAWHDGARRSATIRRRVARELTAGGWRRSGGHWSKGGVRLSVTIALAPERGTWMQVIEQEQLRRAGIDAALKPYPVSLFNAPGGPLRRGAFTLAAAQWIGAADPEESVIFACSQRGGNGNNSMNYCNPRFDALFEDQATTGDPQHRRRRLHRDAANRAAGRSGDSGRVRVERRRRARPRQRLSAEYADVSRRRGVLGYALSGARRYSGTPPSCSIICCAPADPPQLLFCGSGSALYGIGF